MHMFADHSHYKSAHVFKKKQNSAHLTFEVGMKFKEKMLEVTEVNSFNEEHIDLTGSERMSICL